MLFNYCVMSLSLIVTHHHHDRLSGNKLSSIKGEVFAGLNNLNVLNLSHNRFSSITVNVSKSQNFTKDWFCC